jgi:hypothetical protein
MTRSAHEYYVVFNRVHNFHNQFKLSIFLILVYMYVTGTKS